MDRGISELSKVRVRGPLAEFGPPVAVEAQQYGYTPLTVAGVLRLTANLSRWMEARGLGAADLSAELAREFIAGRRAAGRRRGRTLRCLSPVLSALDGAGVLAPDCPARPGSERERLLAGFGQYLRCERALAAGTASAYLARAGRFLDELGGTLDGLAAGDVTAAVLAEAEKVSAGSAQYYVAALRAFLRFAHLDGHTATDLAWAAQAVTGRRRSGLPKGISPADARALLASCDQSVVLGLRDYALLVILQRLGLRASEAAALTLDGIDWRAAEITVHGKGSRDERLPLSADVGEAVAAYLLRGRPASGRRQVFLRAVPPGGAADPQRGLGHRPPGLRAGGAAGDRGAPAAAHRRLPDGRGRRPPAGDRPGPAPPQPGNNRELHADMTQKERAIARTQPLSTTPGRYRAPDALLAFLEGL
jgi:hypothetical protein